MDKKESGNYHYDEYRLCNLFNCLTFDEKLFFLRLIILYSYYKIKQTAFDDYNREEIIQNLEKSLKKNIAHDGIQEMKFYNVVLNSNFQSENENKKVYQKIVTSFDVIERIFFFPLKSDDNIFKDLQSNYNGANSKIKIPVWLKLNCLNEAVIAFKKRIDYLTNYDNLEPLACEVRYQDLLTFKDVVENFKDLYQLLVRKISFFDVIIFLISNVSENNSIYIELGDEQVSKLHQLLKQTVNKKIADLIIQKEDKNYLNFDIFINFFNHINVANINQTNRQIIALVREIILQKVKIYAGKKVKINKQKKNLKQKLQYFITVIEKTEIVLNDELQLVETKKALLPAPQTMRVTLPNVSVVNIKNVIVRLTQIKSMVQEKLLEDFIFDNKSNNDEQNLVCIRPVASAELVAVKEVVNKVKNEVEKVVVIFQNEYEATELADSQIKETKVVLEENLDNVMDIVEEAREQIEKLTEKTTNNKARTTKDINKICEQTDKKIELKNMVFCNYLRTSSNELKKFMLHVTTEKVSLRVHMEKVITIIEKVIKAVKNRKKSIFDKLLIEFLNFHSNVSIEKVETEKMEFLENELKQLLKIVNEEWFKKQEKIVQIKKLERVKTTNTIVSESLSRKQKIQAQQNKKCKVKKDKKKLLPSSNLVVTKNVTISKSNSIISANKEESSQKIVIEQENLEQVNLQMKQKQKKDERLVNNASVAEDVIDLSTIKNLSPAVKEVIAAANAEFAPWTQTNTISKAKMTTRQDEAPLVVSSSPVVTDEKTIVEKTISNKASAVTSKLPSSIEYNDATRNKKLQVLRQMLKNRNSDVQFLQEENTFLKDLIFYLEQAQKDKIKHINSSLEHENIILKQTITDLEQALQHNEGATNNFSLEQENEMLKEYNFLLAQGLFYLQAALQNQPVVCLEKIIEKNTVTTLLDTNHDLVETKISIDEFNNSVVSRRTIGKVMEIVNQQREVVVHPVNVVVTNPIAISTPLSVPVVATNNFNSFNGNDLIMAENSIESSTDVITNHAFL